MDFPNFSFNIVEACKKYGGFFETKSLDQIVEMVLEYKKFWAIIKKYPDNSFPPTKEIDEVWHLHMLFPQYYYDDCLDYFEVVLGHDAGFGKYEEEIPVINGLFDTANELWEKEYGYRLPEATHS